MTNALQRGYMHEDRLSDDLARLKASINSSIAIARNLETKGMSVPQLYDFSDALNELDAALYRIEDLYKERRAEVRS